MNILFVCTGNTCRSPMAKALMEKIGTEKGWKNLNCDSAGLFAAEGSPMSRNAVAALEKIFSLPAPRHKAKSLTKEMLEKADLVLTATEDHRVLLVQKFGFPEKVRAFPENLPDPYGGFLEQYEESAREIYRQLNRLAEEGEIYD